MSWPWNDESCCCFCCCIASRMTDCWWQLGVTTRRSFPHQTFCSLWMMLSLIPPFSYRYLPCLVQVSTVSRTGIYRVHITLHLLVSVVQLLTGVIAVSTSGTGNISMTVCSLVCSTEPQVEKWMWTGYLATLLLIEHSNSRFHSLCKSIRFVKNRPFDSLVVMQFFLLIYCIIFSCHLLFKHTFSK